MKKIFFLLFVACSVSAYSQLVDIYPNNNRFYYHPFNGQFGDVTNSAPSFGRIGNGSMPSDYIDKTIVIREMNIPNDNPITIYGIALAFTAYAPSNPPVYGLPDWEERMLHFDTSHSMVYLAIQGRTGDSLQIVSSSRVIQGQTVITGNYLKLPDDDTLATNVDIQHVISSPYNAVVEVYFDQPVTLSGVCYIGFNNASAIGNSTHYIQFQNQSLLRKSSNCVTDKMFDFFYAKVGDKLVPYSSSFPNHFVAGDSTYWGTPFLIIAPPPCMAPLKPHLIEETRQSATIAWTAQYGSQSYEIEYGPQGFAEGMGTTIGGIASTRVTLSPIDMDADITVRVRSLCHLGAVSDWAELNFHSGVFYSIEGISNNDDWGYVTGGGIFSPGETVKLYAYRKGSYSFFDNWQDGSTQNPRVFTATSDSLFTAFFHNDTVGEEVATVQNNTHCIKVFPNPSYGDVTVALPESMGDCILEVVDIYGRTVVRIPVEPHTPTVHLSNLLSGFYSIILHTSKDVISTKIFIR